MLLLAVALPMAVAGLYWFIAMSRWRRWSALILRALLIALLCAMLAGATSIRRTDKLAVVAVVDISGSVRSFMPPIRIAANPEQSPQPVPVMAAVRRFLERATGKRDPEDLLGIVIFDGSAVAVLAPLPGAIPIPERAFDVQMTEGTDIAAALRLAAAIIPPDASGRILLFSDGVETKGDALAAAREIAGTATVAGDAAQPATGTPRRSAIPIDVVPLEYAVEHEVYVDAVDAPPRAVSGAPVAVRVTLVSTGPATGTLRLLDDAEELDINLDPVVPGTSHNKGRRIALVAGPNTQVLTVKLPPGRAHRLQAIYEPDPAAPGQPPTDTIATNNRGEAFTLTPSGGSVLVLDGVGSAAPDGPGQTLARTWREEGLEVDVVGQDALPADLLRMQAYDLIVLQNVPADALGEDGQKRLATYVTELGGGLIMTGGPDTYAAGGYKGGPLEPVLPVKLDLPDKLLVPAAAVVIIIDCSGSMGWSVMGSSRSQQDIANEGAAAAVRTLTRNDLLGVISFNNDYQEVIPLSKNADADANVKKILTIYPHGGTNLPPALSEGYRQIKAAEAKTKHVIVLSDGVSMNRDLIPDMARNMAADGIKVTAIAVGDMADTASMQEMAKLGSGEYYRIVDPRTLPRIFIKAVRVARTPLVRETPFIPVILAPASPLLLGLSSAGDIPALGGLTLTQPREEPTITLDLASPEGEPVLAHWQAGLGRVACYTSDTHRWGQSWLTWPGYRMLWTQIARTISRAAPQRSSELSTEVVGDQLKIRFSAMSDDKKPIDSLDVSGSVYTPEGQRTEVRLAQVGPGVYETRVSAESSGNYVVTLAPKQNGRPLPPLVGGISRASGIEFRSLRANTRLMTDLARLSGGRTFDLASPPPVDGPQVNRLFNREGLKPKESRTPLWPLLLWWAIAIMLLDVATRRIAWDRLFAGGLSSIRGALRDRTAQSARTLTGLRKRDELVDVAVSAQNQSALGAEDAKLLAKQARERRIAARRAGNAPQPAAPVSPSAAPVTPGSAPITASPAAPAPIIDTSAPSPDPAAPPEGGLRAAKKRAQDRFRD